MQEFHSYYARRIRNHNIIYQPSWWSASMSIAIHHAQHDCFYQSVVWHTTYGKITVATHDSFPNTHMAGILWTLELTYFYIIGAST